MNDLLEDLSVSPLVGLALDLNWLLPSPLLVNELLVLGLGRITVDLSVHASYVLKKIADLQLGECVTLSIWGDVKGWKSLLAADEECAGDDRVIALSVNRHATEKVLARSLTKILISLCLTGKKWHR